MFKKLLVANRGIIRTNCIQAVKELGLRCATFYVQSDNMSISVRMADEAYELTNSDQSTAYYDSDRIVELAVKIKADAVHPGYGFLAEDPGFAGKLKQHNIRLISAFSQADLGILRDKLRMKEIAEELGIPVVPYSRVCTTAKRASLVGRKFGYPIILKPLWGSGGRGIRIVDKESEVEAAYESRVGRGGDLELCSDEVFVEKYFPNARQIEFPVLRDSYGNVVVLPELESSVQRRFHKLMTETPAPFTNRRLLRQLATFSRLLVERLDCVGVASVEFLVEGDQAYFLEVNGYIQPSHTASQRLTGIDLVREQVRLCAGGRLGFSQEDLAPRGHVVSVAVNAEDPEEDFVPCPGVVNRFELPSGSGALVFATARSGDTISTFYEPLLAQIVAVDSTREETIRKLRVVLSGYIIEGIKTNLPFLDALLATDRVREENLCVSMLHDRQWCESIAGNAYDDDEVNIAAYIAAMSLHGDVNRKRILADAVEKDEQYSLWNFTSRIINRRKLEL